MNDQLGLYKYIRTARFTRGQGRLTYEGAGATVGVLPVSVLLNG